jgi:hypothetical protein
VVAATNFPESLLWEASRVTAGVILFRLDIIFGMWSCQEACDSVLTRGRCCRDAEGSIVPNPETRPLCVTTQVLDRTQGGWRILLNVKQNIGAGGRKLRSELDMGSLSLVNVACVPPTCAGDFTAQRQMLPWVKGFAEMLPSAAHRNKLLLSFKAHVFAYLGNIKNRDIWSSNPLCK